MASRTAVLDRVERLLRAGLTAKAFRERVLAELRPVLPYDGHVWLLTDPLTRVGTSPLADVPALDLRDLPNLGRLRYLTTVNRWDVLVAEGRHAATLLGETGGEPERSLLWRECLSGLGVTDVASVVCARPVRLLGLAGPVAHRDDVRRRPTRPSWPSSPRSSPSASARRRRGRSSTTPRPSTCPAPRSSCWVRTSRCAARPCGPARRCSG